MKILNSLTRYQMVLNGKREMLASPEGDHFKISDVEEAVERSNNNERDAITLWREYFASLEGNDVAMFLFHNADRLNAVLA